MMAARKTKKGVDSFYEGGGRVFTMEGGIRDEITELQRGLTQCEKGHQCAKTESSVVKGKQSTCSQ